MTLEQFIQYISDSKYNKYLYHFTDEDNLRSICKHGILSTEQRKNKHITPCYRGGNEASFHAYSACKNASASFGPAVQSALKEVVSHPNFSRLVK